MLSRSAQGLYWMGRYLERAQRLCRLLQLQTEALVDRPVGEIYLGWKRIYASMERQPPGGHLAPGSDDFTLADSYTLADDLTFEQSNVNSVWQCFSLGRENARQMRHRISAEMWTSLNLAYLRVQKLRIQDIWAASPESFYAETAAEFNAFSGVAWATMYRDDGWRFMQLGRFIERAQLLTALLLAHLDLDLETETGDDTDDGWSSLLRAYHALETYGSRHGAEVEPGRALDLLVADPLLPNSLCHSLDAAAAELAGLGHGPDADADAATRRLAGGLAALVNYDWPDQEDRKAFLQQANDRCQYLHSLVTATYFEYRA